MRRALSSEKLPNRLPPPPAPTLSSSVSALGVHSSCALQPKSGGLSALNVHSLHVLRPKSETVLTPPNFQGMREGLSPSRLKSSPTAPLLPVQQTEPATMPCFGCRCGGLGVSLVRFQGWRLARKFKSAGLVERQVKIDTQTSIHCWVSKSLTEERSRPDVGRGSLLLIHGFGASAIWQWANQVDAFHKHFDLVVPDLIFFGGSTSSSEERSETFEAMSMAKMMHDHFKIDRYHVAGISYGGFVAYRMGLQHPDRVRKVVLTDSPGVIMVRSDYEKLLTTYGVASTADLLLPQSTADVKRLMELAYYRPPPAPTFVLRDTLQVMFSDMVEEKKGMLEQLLVHLDNPEVPLPKLTQEVLLVWGEQDPVFPLPLAERLRDFLGKRSSLVVLKKAKHASNIERPKEYNRAVLEFLLQRTPLDEMV